MLLQVAKPCGEPPRTILQLAKPPGEPPRIILQLAKPPGEAPRTILQLAKPPGEAPRIILQLANGLGSRAKVRLIGGISCLGPRNFLLIICRQVPDLRLAVVNEGEVVYVEGAIIRPRHIITILTCATYNDDMSRLITEISFLVF